MARLPMLARSIGLCYILVSFGAITEVRAQSFGIETHNTLMPASGGMGGVSLALPQDLTSAVNGNPATLSQFGGSQYLFGGAWAEPTYNLSQSGTNVIPGVTPFAAKSEAQGLAGGNLGATQDLNMLGLPATFGLAFTSAAAGGADFRQVPASNGTNSVLTVLEVTAGLGVDLTERAAAGVSVALGTGFFDGPFVGIGGMCYDYGLRAALGGTYDLDSFTTIGAYYQTRQHFQFDNAIRLALPALGFSVVQDVEMDLPENIGFGIADNRFLDGNLLLAMDVLYKRWDDADLFAALYDDQWVVQFGAQLTRGRSRCRLGYVWAENPIDPTPGLSAGGVTPPGAVAAIQYAQGLMAVTGQHRISAGFQRQNVLPGLDLDLFAGGMFKSDQQLGAFTATSIQGYWIGLGLTWRFRCVCGRPATACGGSCGSCGSCCR